MTKKHFKALAEAMLASRPEDANGPEYNRSRCEQWVSDVNSICSAILADNPRFDIGKFYDACGYDLAMRVSF